MGLKALKTKFAIEHIVHREGEMVCIGSAYCPTLIEIDSTGTVSESSLVRPGVGELGELLERLTACSRDDLMCVLREPDEIGPTSTVYVAGRFGRIDSAKCEATGFPYTTVEGVLMRSNTHYASRRDAVRRQRTKTRYSAQSHFRLGIEQAGKSLLSLWRGVCACGCLIRLWLLRGY